MLGALCLFNNALWSQNYADPNFPKPTSGYGADGPHTPGLITYDHPYFIGEDIEIHYPADLNEAVPTLFFCHGFGGTNSLYVRGMLQFIARKGYAVVYSPYPTTGVSIEDRYDILREGFRHAARNYPTIIDTTQVGFVGHSFGGGALVGVAYRCFTENNWGQNGRLLFGLAPWYSYQISPTQLSNFPSDTKLIMQVYDEDVLNDHRIAIDIFENINIPDSEKDYIRVQRDTVNGYVYQAGHDLPGTYQTFDAHDYYAFYRLLDALCDYTFHASPEGKVVALGNGDALQTTLPGTLKPLLQSDNPQPVYSQSFYEFECSAALNPRREYCGLTTATQEVVSDSPALRISPNPAVADINISWPASAQPQQLQILDLKGGVVYQQTINGGNTQATFSTTGLSRGIYVVRLGTYFRRFVVAR